jgi:hypothetical protein
MQPIEHGLVEHAVEAHGPLGHAIVVGPGEELLVDPGGLPRRRIRQVGTQRLGPRSLLLGVAGFALAKDHEGACRSKHTAFQRDDSAAGGPFVGDCCTGIRTIQRQKNGRLKRPRKGRNACNAGVGYGGEVPYGAYIRFGPLMVIASWCRATCLRQRAGGAFIRRQGLA